MKTKSIFSLLLVLLTLKVQAMYKMDYEITIGNHSINGIEKVTIESSQELLSDSCVITIPGMIRNVPLDVENKIKRGDQVTVKLGYNGDLKTEFKGYLRAIYPEAPMRLECEDAMYLLRKEVTPKVLTNVTVKQIIEYVLAEVNPQLQTPFTYKSDLQGYKFDRFVIHNTTGYDVLDKLRQETGLMINARDNEIHAHLAFTEGTGNLVTYDFYRNIEGTNDLKYVSQQDVRLKIKIVGRTDKGGKMTVEAGLDGGEARTFQRPTVSDRETLEAIARAELAKMSFDGYRGSLQGWLIPYCTVGYTAKIQDRDYPEREGNYYVQGTKVEFSRSGGIRTVELGRKLG